MFFGHLRIKLRKCPQNTSEPLFGSVLHAQIYSGCHAQIYTVFLECVMFITKYLIVKNICILYLLIWWGFSTSLGEKLVFCCCADDFILYKFLHFLFLIDWLRCNKLNSNGKLVTDNRSVTCTGNYWSFPPKPGTMCSTFSFVLIHFKVICTLHEGGMCLDAWNNKTRQEECIFTCFYFQMIKIKEIFEEIVSLDTSELRFGSVQSFPPPYLHKEPGWKQ